MVIRKKAKLPRKRKKACIKAQGRKSYLDTISLYKATDEQNCKFWVNSKVKQTLVQFGNSMCVLPIPTEYW